MASRQEFAELATLALSDRAPTDDVSPGSPQEHEALLGILNEQIAQQDLSSPPLTATYIHGRPGAPCYLAISLHGIVGDDASRDILLTDIFTAFGQRLAGEEIALQPVSTSWTEWSQSCAALATHPAVLESRDFWLQTATTPALQVVRQDITDPPRVTDLARLPSALTVAQTTEIDDARRRLRVPLEEILLAALSRTIATVIGEATISVDLAGPGRSVLKPDVDLRRTVGWFTTIYPITMTCAHRQHTSARHLLGDVHDTLKAVPHYGIGYGLLRYLYAPTARLLGAVRPADIFVSYAGTIPDLPALSSHDAPVQFDTDTAMPVRDPIPGLGHAIELRIYRAAGALRLDWWHDTRRVASPAAQSLADGFAEALADLVREAIEQDEMDSAGDELALVDLSSSDTDVGEANA